MIPRCCRQSNGCSNISNKVGPSPIVYVDVTTRVAWDLKPKRWRRGSISFVRELRLRQMLSVPKVHGKEDHAVEIRVPSRPHAVETRGGDLFTLDESGLCAWLINSQQSFTQLSPNNPPESIQNIT